MIIDLRNRVPQDTPCKKAHCEETINLEILNTILKFCSQIDYADILQAELLVKKLPHFKQMYYLCLNKEEENIEK